MEEFWSVTEDEGRTFEEFWTSTILNRNDRIQVFKWILKSSEKVRLRPLTLHPRHRKLRHCTTQLVCYVCDVTLFSFWISIIIENMRICIMFTLFLWLSFREKDGNIVVDRISKAFDTAGCFGVFRIMAHKSITHTHTHRAADARLFSCAHILNSLEFGGCSLMRWEKMALIKDGNSVHSI